MINALSALGSSVVMAKEKDPNAAPASKVSRTGDALSVDLSPSRDVFTAVDNFFNLGKSEQLTAFKGLSKEDRAHFFKIVGTLLKNGYMGYENLVVNKKVERHDVTTQIGDKRLRHAKVYEQSSGYKR